MSDQLNPQFSSGSILFSSTDPSDRVELLTAALVARQRDTSPNGLRGWRFELVKGDRVRVGIRNNQVGSAYSPPTVVTDYSGGIYLIWQDGYCSLAKLDSYVLDNLDHFFSEWRSTAYFDEYAAEILPPSPVPSVEIIDPQIRDLFHGDPSFLFSLINRAKEELIDAGVIYVDAGAAAGESKRTLRNSFGLDISYSETGFSFSATADRLYGNGYGKKRFIREDEIAFILKDVIEVNRLLHKPIISLPAGETDIVLPPDIAGEFISTYITGNMSGAGVINKASAYTLEDFQHSRQVTRNDISFVIDPFRPFESGTTPVSSEGVIAHNQIVLDHGCLKTPFLDLKYARRALLEPTSPGALYVVVDSLSTIDKIVSEVSQGVLVYGLLGMHTQDGTSGKYSVNAAEALVIEHGEITGRAKGVLSGNFFNNIMADDLVFGTAPYENNPGLKMRCHWQTSVEKDAPES